jgi:hypothetical protein
VRLPRAADHGLLTADEAQTLAGAFEDIYALVLGHEVRALRGGDLPTSFVAPRELDTLTRRHLRESFRAVRAIQARVDEHWLARLERVDHAVSGQVHASRILLRACVECRPNRRQIQGRAVIAPIWPARRARDSVRAPPIRGIR